MVQLECKRLLWATCHPRSFSCRDMGYFEPWHAWAICSGLCGPKGRDRAIHPQSKINFIEISMYFLTFFVETRFTNYWFFDQKRSETVVATFPKYPRIINNLIVSSMFDFNTKSEGVFIYNFVIVVRATGQHGFQNIDLLIKNDLKLLLWHFQNIPV